MGLQAVYVLWLRDMKLFIRAKSMVIATIFMPFLWLSIMGLGLGRVTQIPGYSSYLDFLAPGIIGMSILFRATMAGVSVMWDRQFGFMKEILVAPISRVYIMLGKAFGGTTTAMIQGLLILVSAVALGASMPGVVGLLIAMLFMVVLALGFVSLGLAMASKITDPVAFPVIMNFLILPIFFLSGAVFPISTAPDWLSALAHINPMTYAVDGLRGAFGGATLFPIWIDLAVLTFFTMMMILLGSYLFKKMKV